MSFGVRARNRLSAREGGSAEGVRPVILYPGSGAQAAKPALSGTEYVAGACVEAVTE